MNAAQIDNIFTYHTPTGTQQERYEGLRKTARAFAHLINESCPESREKSLALTDLQRCVQMANTSIAINENVVDADPSTSVSTGDARNARYIAMVCHEVNRAYCAGLGDHSQLAWADAPQWQRDSAVAGVNAILADPVMTPQGSHEGWCLQKLRDGWKTGPVKDAEKKEHPCLVPYDELPAEQRTKDYLFGAVVRAIAFAG